MIDSAQSRILRMRILFAFMALCLVMVQVMPLDRFTAPHAGPDMLAALTVAWCIRRTDLVPIPVVLMVWLFSDLVLQRPIGLMTGLMLICVEWMRMHNRQLRELSVMSAIIVGAIILGIVQVANWMLLRAFLVPAPAPSMELSQYGFTVLALIIALLLSLCFPDLRRAAQIHGDTNGKRR